MGQAVCCAGRVGAMFAVKMWLKCDADLVKDVPEPLFSLQQQRSSKDRPVSRESPLSLQFVRS